jgi:hypothetical protein
MTMANVQDWVRDLVRTRAREELIAAFGMFLVVCAAGFVTTFVVLGMFFALGVVFGALGVVPPHPTVIAPVVIALQLVVFYLLKPKFPPPLVVERAEDTGEMIVIKTPQNLRPTAMYDQEGTGSLRSMVLAILLSTAIAIHECLKHIRESMTIRATDVEGVTALAEYISAQNAKVSYTDLQQDLPDLDLKKLLPQVHRLPGFNLISSDPQGLALTENAYESLGAAT